MNMVRRPQKPKAQLYREKRKKKQWLHSYNFILVTLESFWPKKYYLTEEVYLAENVFKNSARHECKRILPKSVKT